MEEIKSNECFRRLLFNNFVKDAKFSKPSPIIQLPQQYDKNTYYNSHVNHVINVPNEEIIVTEGDFNGIIEKDHDDFDDFHVCFGYGNFYFP